MQDRYLISKALELGRLGHDSPDVIRTADTILRACIRASGEVSYAKAHGRYDLVLIHDTLTGERWPMDRSGPDMVRLLTGAETRRLEATEAHRAARAFPGSLYLHRDSQAPVEPPAELDPRFDNPNGTVLFF